VQKPKRLLPSRYLRSAQISAILSPTAKARSSAPTRYITGTLTTDYGYTGQRNEAGLGLMDYGARYYDPALGRFVSADTVVPNPGNPQDLNRYAYVRNNPLNYIDPTGHKLQCDSDGNCTDVDSTFTSYDAHERRMELVNYNNQLYEWVQGGFPQKVVPLGAVFIVILWKCSESTLATSGWSSQPKEREKGQENSPSPLPLLGKRTCLASSGSGLRWT